MNEGFDLNAVTADLIESQVGAFIELLKSSGRHLSQTLILSWKRAFKTYIEDIADKHSRARSFFHRAEPEYLYRFYVPIGVTTKNRRLKRADALPLFAANSHVVIEGSGGSGKSVLTRHLLLDILRTKQRVPVLVELRSLNHEKQSLVSLISKGLGECGLEVGENVIQNAITKGTFALLFDGFDELNDEIRADVAQEICNLARLSKKTWILVTSRPDDIFSGWTDFSLYSTAPLTLDLAIELVEKSPVEVELKQRFIADLKASLFAKHESFLSNPLLLSIMLLTYQDAADIPKKLSVFYSLAYEALFQRHDAWKGAYKRQRKCDFDIHDFSRLFAAFSLVAYDKRLFSFSQAEAVAIVKTACSLTSLEADPVDFLHDCTQAVCMIVQDGLQLSYSHRSFQEFFAAKFIAESSPALKQKLLDRCGRNIAQDNVIKLLHEMQPAFVEASFLLPEIRSLLSAIGVRRDTISRRNHFNFLKLCFSSFRVAKPDEIWGTHKDPSAHKTIALLWFAAENCAYLVGDHLHKPNKVDVSNFCQKLCNGVDTIELETTDLNVRHPFVAFCYKSGVSFGSAILRMGCKVAKEIERRAALANRPLEEILDHTLTK